VINISWVLIMVYDLGLWCLTPLSTIFLFISWRSVLLVGETRVPGENHRQSASHNVVSSTRRHERDWNSQH
jgi:hypothetical protein